MVEGSRSISRMFSGRRFSPIAILAALLLGLGLLAGCGGDDGEAGDGAEQAAEQEPAQEQPADEQPADGEPSEEPADGAGDAAAGEEIFAAQCSTCHGPDGGGGSAPSLQQRQDLADDRSIVVDQVTNGGGGMPAFEGQLSEQEINDVAAYVSEEIATQ